MRSRAVSVIVAMLIVASGCTVRINGLGVVSGPAITGSGVEKQEAREAGDFDRIEIQNALTAKVEIGPKASVEVRGDDNVVPLVETEVKDGTLFARLKSGASIMPKLPLEAVITVPKLVAVEADGASKIEFAGGRVEDFTIGCSNASHIEAKGLEAREVKIKASGASKVIAAGTAENLHVTTSGASSVQASALAAQTVEVESEGASQVEVRTSESIRGSITSASRLQVTGNPAQRGVTTSTASSVDYVP